MYEKYVDEIIGMLVVAAGIGFIIMGIPVEEWYQTIMIMVIAFYFRNNQKE